MRRLRRPERRGPSATPSLARRGRPPRPLPCRSRRPRRRRSLPQASRATPLPLRCPAAAAAPAAAARVLQRRRPGRRQDQHRRRHHRRFRRTRPLRPRHHHREQGSRLHCSARRFGITRRRGSSSAWASPLMNARQPRAMTPASRRHCVQVTGGRGAIAARLPLPDGAGAGRRLDSAGERGGARIRGATSDRNPAAGARAAAAARRSPVLA